MTPTTSSAESETERARNRTSPSSAAERRSTSAPPPPAPPGQVHVEQHDLGAQLVDGAHRRVDIARLADDLDVSPSSARTPERKIEWSSTMSTRVMRLPGGRRRDRATREPQMHLGAVGAEVASRGAARARHPADDRLPYAEASGGHRIRDRIRRRDRARTLRPPPRSPRRRRSLAARMTRGVRERLAGGGGECVATRPLTSPTVTTSIRTAWSSSSSRAMCAARSRDRRRTGRCPRTTSRVAPAPERGRCGRSRCRFRRDSG